MPEIRSPMAESESEFRVGGVGRHPAEKYPVPGLSAAPPARSRNPHIK
jgi:hypothetical protein